VFVTPEQRRRYYKDNAYKFVTTPNVRYALFYVESKQEADTLMAQLRRGVHAEEIVRADSLKDIVRGRVSTARQDDQGAPFRKKLFEEMKDGQLHLEGPNTEGAYNVLQKIASDSGRPVAFAEADAQIDEYLQQEQSDKLLAAFTKRHRRGMRIVSRPDLLMRIRLVNPQTAD